MLSGKSWDGYRVVSPTHYDVLGVASTASVEEIRFAYRVAARQRHPDSGGSVDAMQQLNEAWHVLSDPGRRAAYDRSLAQAVGPSRPRARSSRPASGSRQSESSTPSVDPDADLGLDPDDLAMGPAWHDAGPATGVEGWWAMLPPTAFVLAVCLGAGAIVFGSPTLLVFSGGAFFVSLGLFVLVPLRSMLQSSRRRARRSLD